MEHQDPRTRPSGDDPFDPDQARGLVASLFDLSFESFVTPKLIQVVFMVMLGVSGLWTLAMITAGFTRGMGPGLLALVVSPLLFLVAVLFARMYLELVIVLFRIYEVLQERR